MLEYKASKLMVVLLLPSVLDSTNVEEEEVRKMVWECLELRNKYVYREEIAPWTKEPVTEPSTPKARSDPFHFEPVEKTAVSFFLLINIV